MARHASISTLGAVLLVATAGACADPDLERLQMPQGGVRLRHALAPGTERATSVRVETTDASGTASVEADGRWSVPSGEPPAQGIEVRARFDRVALSWPGADAATQTAVAGAEIRVHVSTGGAATAEPGATGDARADEVIAVLGDALARSFVVASPKPVARGDRWTWAPPAGTSGDLDAAVDGYGRTRDRGEDVVVLDLGQRGQISEGAASTSLQLKGRAWFAIDGYVALYDVAIERGDGQRRRITVRTAEGTN